MRKTHFTILGLVAAIMLLATSCGGQQSVGVATDATFNGVQTINSADGTADLSVSALDAQGNVLSSGTITNASVTIDGQTTANLSPQQLSATASVCSNISGTSSDLRAMVTLDGSGSMSSTDPNELRNEAAKRFVGRLGSSDEASIGLFGVSPSSGFSVLKIETTDSNGDPVFIAATASNKTALEADIDAATVASGGTPLWQAGVESVNFASSTQTTTRSRVVVLLTDGNNNGSGTAQDVIDAATQANPQVTVFTIGLGANIDTQDLANVAAGTNGTFSQVTDAQDLPGLFNSVFNATQGAGCIQIDFNTNPASGTNVSGTLSFQVNGNSVSTGFSFIWP